MRLSLLILALKTRVPDSDVSTSCVRSHVYLRMPDMMPSRTFEWSCYHSRVMAWERRAEWSDAPAAEVPQVRPAALFLSGGGSAVVWVRIASRTSPDVHQLSCRR